MPSFKVTPEQLSQALAGHAKMLPLAFQQGALKSAHRAKAHLVRSSPVDLGLFKNSWVVLVIHDFGGGARVHNFAPHAGIIELGARPHPVSRKGIEALTAWARRKILTGMTRKKYAAETGRKPPKIKKGQSWKDVEASRIAWAVAAKIKKVGQKGLYLVQKNLAVYHRFLVQEVARAIKKAMAEKYGGAR